ncbi:hypothetical protein GTQ99_19285, partial [Kineococcus sp. T13]
MSDEQAAATPHPPHPATRRAAERTATRTSAAFGAVEVGPPVSRLAPAEPQPEPRPEPVAAARPQRCPSCAARVRPEQDWC